MSSPVSGVGQIGTMQQVMNLRRQIIDQSETLSALRQAGNETRVTTQPSGETGFAETLREAVGRVNDSQLGASQISEAYERGEVTDIAQVMMARQEAGVAFEATLQVRNKLLSAYQDIMRMGV